MHDPHDSQAAYPFLWLSSHLNLPVSYLLLSFTSETTSRQSCLLCGNYSMPGRQHCIRAFGHCKSSMLHTLWAPLASWRISVLYPSWAPPPLMVHICAWCTWLLYGSLSLSSSVSFPVPILNTTLVMKSLKLLYSFLVSFKLQDSYSSCFLVCVVCVCSCRVCMYACECTHTLVCYVYMFAWGVYVCIQVHTHVKDRS